tara:strand:- start:80 stop:1039 length:960 start_codon:yes stop_codon:yes gene_type:complete
MSDSTGDAPSMSERLNATGSKLAELSKKAALATKSAVIKTTEVSIDAAQSATKASKNAVAKTNEKVKQAVQDSKEKRNEKRELKAQKAKEELLSEPILNDVPAMITLPEFENERMEVVNEQQTNQLLLLEEMQRLSSRLDTLERKHKNSVKHSSSELIPVEESVLQTESRSDTKQMIGTSEAMGEMLHILGASLLWIVALVGMDQFATDQELMLTEAYPGKLLIWSVGSFTWVMYLLHRLGKSGLKMPLLIRVQAALAVGITTLMGLMLNDDSMSTVSNVWTWGTILAIALLLGSSMLATAWRSTKKLVGIRETVEIID